MLRGLRRVKDLAQKGFNTVANSTEILNETGVALTGVGITTGALLAQTALDTELRKLIKEKMVTVVGQHMDDELSTEAMSNTEDLLDITKVDKKPANSATNPIKLNYKQFVKEMLEKPQVKGSIGIVSGFAAGKAYESLAEVLSAPQSKEQLQTSIATLDDRITHYEHELENQESIASQVDEGSVTFAAPVNRRTSFDVEELKDKRASLKELLDQTEMTEKSFSVNDVVKILPEVIIEPTSGSMDVYDVTARYLALNKPASPTRKSSLLISQVEKDDLAITSPVQLYNKKLRQ